MEGAEPAVGRCAAPGDIQGQRHGFLAGERGGVAGEQFAGIGGAGAGGPDGVQDVFQVGVCELDVVLGHAIADLSKVAADVGQAGTGAEQVGRERVTGLVGHGLAEVECVHPVGEVAVEERVADGFALVGVADIGREQGDGGSFVGSGHPAVAVLEANQGFAAALVESAVEGLGDADAFVVVADLGLVVPEHRQAAVAADAVEAKPENLIAATAGEHDGFPDIPQASVFRVVGVGELAEVGLVCECVRQFVGKRVS